MRVAFLEDRQRFKGNFSAVKENHLLCSWLSELNEKLHKEGVCLCSPKNSTKVKDGSY